MCGSGHRVIDSVRKWINDPPALPAHDNRRAAMGIANDVSSFAATVLRLGRGVYPAITADRRPDPKQLLELYNMEGSPFCRKVREALSELDLEHIVRNVPKGSPKRNELAARGGKVQVPYLIDPNTQSEMYESDDIVAYLEEEYGTAPQAARRR